MKSSLQKPIEGMIGLEIHCYILTKEKLFCRCAAHKERGTIPNTFVCPTCTGQPGAKPMNPNKSAVMKSIQIGLMLGCSINNETIWQRKHYDWPDMPKGYQNTISGSYAIPTGVNGKFNGIRILSMHLEEDPASWNPDTGEVDYNRSGLPLVEIVTAPDFSTSEEVSEWLKKLLHSLSYLKAIDSNAGIKVDVNVNIPGKTDRVEIKNLNSIENIARAIDYEINRQSKEGGVRETRRFDDNRGITIRMRGKEEQEDYRFIPDPDLQNIIVDDKIIDEIRDKLPESPDVKLSKLIKKYKIDERNANILARHLDVVEFFEKTAEKIEGKFALPWITIELLRLLNEHKTTLDKVQINIEHFVALLKLVKEGKITELQGKQILRKFYPKSFMPSNVATKITDEKELQKVALGVIKKNAKAADDYKNGEQKAFDFLMGEVMRATEKRADYKIARNLLEKLLNN